MRATASLIGRPGNWAAATSERVWPAKTVVAWSIWGAAALTEAAIPTATAIAAAVTTRVIMSRPRRVSRVSGTKARSPGPTRRSCGRTGRDGIGPGVGASSQATAADMTSSDVVRILMSKILAPPEQVSDRTSVRFVARAADNVETRLEQVFETC